MRPPNDTAPSVPAMRAHPAHHASGARSAELRAQDSTAAPGRQWMVGGSLGMPGSGSQAAGWRFTTVGMHFTQVQPGAPGADISVGILPYGLASGTMVLASRVGVTVPFAVWTRRPCCFPPRASASSAGRARAVRAARPA